MLLRVRVTIKQETQKTLWFLFKEYTRISYVCIRDLCYLPAEMVNVCGSEMYTGTLLYIIALMCACWYKFNQ